MIFNKKGPSNLWTEGGARKNWYNNEQYKRINQWLQVK